MLLLLHFSGAAFLARWSWHEVHRARVIPENARLFKVPTGYSLNQVLELLASNDLAPHPLIVRAALVFDGRDILIKKGTYQLPDRASTWTLLELFDQGLVMLQRLTLPEGLDKWEVAELLGNTAWGSREEFQTLIDDPTLILPYDPQATDLEGYLFPETYHFEGTATPAEIVNSMVLQFLKQTESLRAEAQKRELALRDLVSLASLVEAESAVPGERATIAGVFTQRLKRGMLLQCDPTIIYSLKRHDRYRGKIYLSDIQFQDPYNTYTSPGLPPGPICNPGLAALEAALNPENTPFLYFVARNDGTHHFSQTLREHNRAVRQYQR